MVQFAGGLACADSGGDTPLSESAHQTTREETTMKDQLVLGTLEALVAHTIKTSNGYGRKYTLGVMRRDEWVDVEAGQAWEDQYYATNGLERTKLAKSKPTKVEVMVYSLTEFTTHGSADYIVLSEVLGEMALAVWPTKKSRFGDDTELKGARTLEGLLKLLGKSDIGEQLKDAEVKVAAAELAESKAYAQKKIVELAKELADYLLLAQGKTEIRSVHVYGTHVTALAGDGSVELLVDGLGVIVTKVNAQVVLNA